MRSALFVCLLVIAGVSALSETDVAPTQERIVDLWLRSQIEAFQRRVREAGLDPAYVKRQDFDHILIDGLIEVIGYAESLKLSGISDIAILRLDYSILFGRLDFHVCWPRIALSVGKYRARAVIIDRGGEIDVSGSLEVNDICLGGNALLLLDAVSVTLLNIDVDFNIGNIKSDARVGYKCRGCLTTRDLSDIVNFFLNYRIPELLTTYRLELNTIIGEAIRYFVNWVNPGLPR